MILSYVHVLLSTQIAAIRDTRIQGKSRAIYFRTLRAASRIEGATPKYTLYSKSKQAGSASAGKLRSLLVHSSEDTKVMSPGMGLGDKLTSWT